MQRIELEASRLLLRSPQLADLDAWAEFTADPECMRFLGGVQGRSAAWCAMMCMAGPKASVWKVSTQICTTEKLLLENNPFAKRML